MIGEPQPSRRPARGRSGRPSPRGARRDAGRDPTGGSPSAGRWSRRRPRRQSPSRR